MIRGTGRSMQQSFVPKPKEWNRNKLITSCCGKICCCIARKLKDGLILLKGLLLWVCKTVKVHRHQGVSKVDSKVAVAVAVANDDDDHNQYFQSIPVSLTIRTRTSSHCDANQRR
jgi:hypothetical protein